MLLVAGAGRAAAEAPSSPSPDSAWEAEPAVEELGAGDPHDPPPPEPWVGLTLPMAQALAARANLAPIAARLGVGVAEARQRVAGLWENPSVQAAANNFILGQPFDQDKTPEQIAAENFHPRGFDQRQLSVELAQQIDLWRKRPLRRRAARAEAEVARLALADVLRLLRYEVAEAFGQVVRGQAEVALARRTHATYRQTLHLCRARRRLGDISQVELDKIELEQLRYVDQEVTAQAGLRQARLRLAAALALPDDRRLPPDLSLPAMEPGPVDVGAALAGAVARRPDLRAARAGVAAAEHSLRAERRERWPDPTLSVAYTASKFQASGDNPHALGLGLGLGLPLWQRQQAEVAAAYAALGQARAEAADLEVRVRREVWEAVAAGRLAATRLRVLHPQMQARAERAQSVAARAWRAGSTSLLEFLEADRTFLEIQRDVLEARDDWRQAAFSLQLAVAEAPDAQPAS